MSKRIGKYKVSDELSMLIDHDVTNTSPSSLDVSGKADFGGEISGSASTGLFIGATGGSFISGSLGNLKATGYISGKAKSYTANNDSAVSVTMTEANYAAGAVLGLDMDASTNDIAYTLPAATAGLGYTFIVNTTAGSGVSLTISAPSAILNGSAQCDDGSEDIVGTNFIIANTKAIKGTKIEVLSDGTIWNIVANCLCDVGDVSTT
tara:strand:- start:272 stop:892 length:621 start_codon:yes stop_codon:yes gene_type:complete